MSGEPCEDCRTERIRIGTAAALAGATLTGAIMFYVFRVRA